MAKALVESRDNRSYAWLFPPITPQLASSTVVLRQFNATCPSRSRRR
jgi:hypothetical protein